MFGKVLSFCTRRDGAFKRKAARRLGSSRASVYLEYALVLPLTVLIISAMIEFAAFWDAKIMANHAAWTCARIATVEAGQKNYTKDGREPVVVTRGMKTATILLMSTCSMGSMHGTAGDFAKNWFIDLIKTPLMKLQKEMMDKLQKKLEEALKKAIGKFVGDDDISKIVKEFLGVITDNLIKPLIDEVAKGIASLFEPMFVALGDVLDGSRQLRQLAYAARRLNEFPKTLTVVERDKSPFIFAKEGDIGQIGDSRLDFPRILDATVNNDSWFVSNDAPWPPNNQWQRMIDVKITWPFERAWMFPVLSQWKSPDKGGKDDKNPLEGMPVAVGRAMAYPQPIIKNDNLKSKGAEPYAPGKEMVLPDIVKKIKDKYIGFLKVAAFYYHYQLTTEETGPYDSWSSGSGSYKGLGHPIAGKATKSDIYDDKTGLVVWMDRIPNKPEDGNEWVKKKAPADYLKSWQKASGAQNEDPLFWKGIAFHALGKYEALRNLENHEYRKKEWFFWGKADNDNDVHRRLQHKAPIDNYKLFSGEWSGPIRFILPENASKTRSQGIAQSIFDARSLGRFPYSRYVDVTKEPNADNVLRMNAYTLADVWCRDTDWVRNEEERRFRRLRDDDQGKHAASRKLIEDCSREIDNAVGDGGGGGAGNLNDLINFGGLDDLIMNDPKKAVEILDKRLQELKSKVFPAIQKIDDAERRLRNLDESFVGKRNHWSGTRECTIYDFAIAIAQKSLEIGSLNPYSIREALRNDGRGGGNPRGDGATIYAILNEIRDYLDKYDRAINDYYNAQIELGKALNCKAAKEAEKKRDDPRPLPGPGGHPDRPKPSSAQSGSDQDNGGDYWRLEEKGWMQYNGEPDI